MKISILKAKLNIILKKLNEFRRVQTIMYPKPEFERLFKDYKEISIELKSINEDVFKDLDSNLSYSTESEEGFTGERFAIYDKSTLELLLFEVEKTVDYISLIEKEKTADSINQTPLIPLNIIAEKFHAVARQLRKRYGKREPYNVVDEYDVQDLYHGLLKLFFNDIRPESYVPEYAGGNSRIDFVLKDERVAIEIKKSRESLKSKQLGEQLIIDIERYKEYPGIEYLYCFVYDPEGWIDNPTGLENDLSKTNNGLKVIVKIQPQ